MEYVFPRDGLPHLSSVVGGAGKPQGSYSRRAPCPQLGFFPNGAMSRRLKGSIAQIVTFVALRFGEAKSEINPFLSFKIKLNKGQLLQM